MATGSNGSTEIPPSESVSNLAIKPASLSLPTVKHAAAVIGYVTTRGIQSDRIDALCRAIADRSSNEVLPCDKFDDYTAVSKLIAPVSGDSLVDSGNVDYIIRSVRFTTYWVLGFILTRTILNAWFADIPEPEEGLLWWVFQFQLYILGVPAPFLWGALGSCVYLLKRFSDLAEARLFDEGSLQGWGTRILLGAILGGIVQFIYDSKGFTAGGLRLDADALGFLSGLGVKVVYGAIEKTIAALGEAMNLDSIRKAPTRENAVRKFLADEMAAEGDEDKRKIIAELLEKASTKQPSA